MDYYDGELAELISGLNHTTIIKFIKRCCDSCDAEVMDGLLMETEYHSLLPEDSEIVELRREIADARKRISDKMEELKCYEEDDTDDDNTEDIELCKSYIDIYLEDIERWENEILINIQIKTYGLLL